MNKKGLGAEQAVEIVLFLAAAIVIIGAVIVYVPKLQGASEAEGLRAKVELAVKGKNLIGGISLASPETFRCGTKRLYWNENTLEDVADNIKDETYVAWYAYGEGRLDFISNWAGEYFKSEENPACYVCSIATNSKYFGPNEKWNLYLVGENNEYWEEDEFFRSYYFYDPKQGEPLFGIKAQEYYIFPNDKLDIGPDDPLFIGVSIVKFNSEKYAEYLVAETNIEYLALETVKRVFLTSSLKKESFVLIPFAMDQKSLSKFCKREIFIDV